MPNLMDTWLAPGLSREQAFERALEAIARGNKPLEDEAHMSQSRMAESAAEVLHAFRLRASGGMLD